jgi:hypothetical protein
VLVEVSVEVLFQLVKLVLVEEKVSGDSALTTGDKGTKVTKVTQQTRNSANNVPLHKNFIFYLTPAFYGRSL